LSSVQDEERNFELVQLSQNLTDGTSELSVKDQSLAFTWIFFCVVRFKRQDKKPQKIKPVLIECDNATLRRLKFSKAVFIPTFSKTTTFCSEQNKFKIQNRYFAQSEPDANKFGTIGQKEADGGSDRPFLGKSKVGNSVGKRLHLSPGKASVVFCLNDHWRILVRNAVILRIPEQENQTTQ
jgi:hypothetical protein